MLDNLNRLNLQSYIPIKTFFCFISLSAMIIFLWEGGNNFFLTFQMKLITLSWQPRNKVYSPRKLHKHMSFSSANTHKQFSLYVYPPGNFYVRPYFFSNGLKFSPDNKFVLLIMNIIIKNFKNSRLCW